MMRRVTVRAWGPRRGAALAIAAAATGAFVVTVGAQRGSLQITLGDADVRLVGSPRTTVQISSLTPGDAASARDVSMSEDADGVLRIGHASDARSTRRVRVRIDAPASLPVTLQVSHGAVRLEDMSARVSVRVVRGSIASRGLRGRTRLEVESGSIAAEAVRLSDAHSLKCRTFNGDVTVALAAAPVDARVLVLTLNGAIRSTLPLVTRAAFGPRFGETTIGLGAHVLSVDVVRGDVSITAPAPR